METWFRKSLRSFASPPLDLSSGRKDPSESSKPANEGRSRNHRTLQTSRTSPEAFDCVQTRHRFTSRPSVRLYLGQRIAGLITKLERNRNHGNLCAYRKA